MMGRATTRWMRGCGLLLACLMMLETQAVAAEPKGVEISYQLSMDGPLPRTYRVTLAITDPNNPDWIISTFVAGGMRTVTQQNQGRFTDHWNGLDDNHMPIPPGEYGVKGIYMPAEVWAVDGQAHTIIPRYRMRISPWAPTPEQDMLQRWVSGDPVDTPLLDVDVHDDGIGVFLYGYLENAVNNIKVDLRRPIDHGQVLANYPSGGAGGGTVTATDGDRIWTYTPGGGLRFIYRADGPWGKQDSRYRRNVVLPEGHVTAIDAQRLGQRSLVYVAMRGRLVEVRKDRAERCIAGEDIAQPINRIDVLDGDDASVLGSIAIAMPLAIKLHGGALYALQEVDGVQRVVCVSLQDGLPRGQWQPVFNVPAHIKASDLEISPGGHFFVTDPGANHTYRLDTSGTVQQIYGRQDAQQPGHYDRLTLMSPARLAAWRDPEGQDRLIIVETHGPNRVSEWSMDGQLLREWISLQTISNHGYTVDPQQPDHLYIRGHGQWLTRFKVDWKTGEYEVDAVWPGVAAEPFDFRCDTPQIFHVNGRKYLTFSRNGVVYRFDGDRCLVSAGFVRVVENNRSKYYVFRDENGDGIVSENEWRNRPMEHPRGTFRYWGERWFSDLSWVALGQGTADVWRLPVSGFDEHGNPIYQPDGWQKVLSDPVFLSRREGTATALYGGNEMDEAFTSPWAMPAEGPDGTIYIGARGGPDEGANFGGQYKLSRYDPDPAGGYRLRWRVGRVAQDRVALPGELYGSIFVNSPVNDLIGVVDQTRAGYLIYTTDGLYVDTILADLRRVNKADAGMYWNGGEFFAGQHFVDADGQVYLAMGKETPIVFALQNWTTDSKVIHRLETLPATVTLRSSDIAPPPAKAIIRRGGRSGALLASFKPSTGGAPAMDGSEEGWSHAATLTFEGGDDQQVTVQPLYDRDNIYLRWHARLGREVRPVDREPLDRIFTHGRGADTLSFYLQGDPDAPPAKGSAGRPGDARFVFALTKGNNGIEPVVLGMYSSWPTASTARPLTYESPVGRMPFAHVAPVKGAELAYRLDEDRKGFVLVARLPRSELSVTGPLPDLRTRVNFDATFNGHNRFWWANLDGSASRETHDEPSEAGLYPGSWAQAHFESPGEALTVYGWSVLGPFSGAELNGVNSHEEAGKRRIHAFFQKAVFPPDRGEIDLSRTYRSEQTIVNGKQLTVSWKQVMVDPEQPSVGLGRPGEKHYAVTWIYVPRAMTIRCCVYLGVNLNHATVEVAGKKYQPQGQQSEHAIAFEMGWNRVFYQGYSTGYPLRIGLQILGEPDLLWQIRTRATPPEEQ